MEDVNTIKIKMSVTEATYLLDAINLTLDADVVNFVPCDERISALNDIKSKIDDAINSAILIY